uniref:Uncharacterized protein n=1 Tax=Mustela putorius furo TaxID=9669 RepID=M3YYI7_MUSPF
MFIAAMFTIAKLCKEPRCPSTDQWIKKRTGHTAEMAWGFVSPPGPVVTREPQRREKNGCLVQVEITVLWLSYCKSEDPSSSPSPTTSGQMTLIQTLNLQSFSLFFWKKKMNK